MKLKLLNINAAAKCLHSNYAGPVLPENSEIFSVPLTLSKNKILLLDGLMDTLKNLFSASNLIRTQHDTRMGFVIGMNKIFVLNESFAIIEFCSFFSGAKQFRRRMCPRQQGKSSTGRSAA